MRRYANVHADVSACGCQTGEFYAGARASMAQALGVRQEEYAVIFAGAGMTGCVSKLAHLLCVHPKTCGRSSPRRAVVFIGPYEHHSNEVFWREMDCDVVVREANG